MKRIIALAIVLLALFLVLSARAGSNDGQIVLVGDSIAALAPYPYPRLAICGAPVHALAERIPHLPIDYKVKHFVIIAGTAAKGLGFPDEIIAAEINNLSMVLKLRFKVPVHIITYQEIAQYAEIDSPDGIHLGIQAYRKLQQDHPELSL